MHIARTHVSETWFYICLAFGAITVFKHLTATLAGFLATQIKSCVIQMSWKFVKHLISKRVFEIAKTSLKFISGSGQTLFLSYDFILGNLKFRKNELNWCMCVFWVGSRVLKKYTDISTIYQQQVAQQL